MLSAMEEDDLRPAPRLIPPAIAVAAVATGCGGTPSPDDEIRAAVEEYFEGLREQDVDVVCRKLFPTTVLPEGVAEQLEIREGEPGASTAGWKEHERQCRSELGRQGEFETAAPATDVSVKEVTRLAGFRPMQGITDAARARLATGERSYDLPLVRFEDDWKVVFIVR